MHTIDLTGFTADGKVRNLSGKDRGISARRQFNLDALDQDSDVVKVHVPDYVYAISTSFFCGMFAQSYAALGRSGLLAKYNFDVPPKLWRQIEQGLERCSYEPEPLV